MIAALHAVARQAQDVADAKRGGSEHVPLDGDAVIVPAGNLHDRRIADPGQERADRDAGHVAVRAGAVCRVDAVDPALEDVGTLVNVVGIAGIGRVQFGGDGKLAPAQHALEPPQ